MDAPATPAGDEYDYIDPAVIDAHLAANEAAIAAEAAGIVAEDDDDGHWPQDQPSEDDEVGYGPDSYFARAMAKDD